MKKNQVLSFAFLFVLTNALLCSPLFAASAELARLQRQANNVSITRDTWGIAHVTGKTDADAIFGMIYAQAEDDFNRVETNYLNAMGRLAEAEGESAIWRDLRMKIFIRSDDLKKKFNESPAWLKKLMTAWADGLNFYLLKHPETKPRVITKFEPWMALSFTEGSIGGDIESINLNQLRGFYGGEPVAEVESKPDPFAEPSGSNGIAIAPKNTTGGNSLLLINPHTSFFFRSELQVTSGEGLNVYGAATWGQIFIYQGFNERMGWMHTSSQGDAIDEWRETVVKKGDKYFYKFGTEERPVKAATIKVPYKTATGMAERQFTVYATHHGPVVRKLPSGEWVTVGLMNNPVTALTQSYTRTKARNFKEFRQNFEFHTNSSNNTLYADTDGNIAYFHSNFIPRRNPKFDWTKPVDGTDPESDWKGVHSFDESPNAVNPDSGWVYNSNDSPWQAAGPSSRKQADFPKYIDNGIPSARGRHAVMVLQNRQDYTLDKLRDAAYDSYLPWFEKTIPALVAAWDKLQEGNPLKQKVRDMRIETLRKWDFRWSTDSVATSLAVFWGMEMLRSVTPTPGVPSEDNVLAKASSKQMLEALSKASDKIKADFGTWQTPWGNINRFQRLTGDIVHPFNDAGASLPVGFTSGNWGSLASFGIITYRDNKKFYGTSGNSFVAVVEFGKRVRARAVTAGGESGHPDSPHFNDQAERYSKGDLREVYFYPDQLQSHIERQYKPGDR